MLEFERWLSGDLFRNILLPEASTVDVTFGLKEKYAL